MRTINLVVIHCSASADGVSLARFAPGAPVALTAAQVIDDWHRQRGFRRAALDDEDLVPFNPLLPHIGYHYVIDIDGVVETGRGLDEVGAHAAGFNAASIGICMVGTKRYTPAQWQALTGLLAGGLPLGTQSGLLAQFHIPWRTPRRIYLRGSTRVRVVDGVCGHRDLSIDQNRNGEVEPFEWMRTCPGYDVRTWLLSGFVPSPENVFDPPPNHEDHPDRVTAAV